jgi:hypothetical protein
MRGNRRVVLHRRSEESKADHDRASQQIRQGLSGRGRQKRTLYRRWCPAALLVLHRNSGGVRSGLHDVLLDFDAQAADDATAVPRRRPWSSQPGPMQDVIVGQMMGSNVSRRGGEGRLAQSLVVGIGSHSAAMRSASSTLADGWLPDGSLTS